MKQFAGTRLFDQDAKRLPTWMLVTATILSVTVALVSFRYFHGAVKAPPIIEANAFRHPWLTIHVAGAATALLLGPAQFFGNLRARSPQTHRWTGRLYVIGCMIGAVSGLVLALGASTGSVTTAGFATLASAWLVATCMGWLRAVQGRINAHRIWMMRSFALTLAAVTLRIYLPVAQVLPFPFVSSYQAISFLCWVPNLLLAELSIRRRPR